jgi:aryl-alcohol dehydrogenase-like predicted oxidoreductase
VTALAHARLGRSELTVSRIALGSWRTFERMPREDGVAVMHAAREAGIDFLDDARYDDETGTAPIPTGYSEVVFGELFRASGWRRDEVVVANKLWWEFWPEQDAAGELDASLQRMGLDHLDLAYSEKPPADRNAPGRVAAQRDDPALAAAFVAGDELDSLAAGLDSTPAAPAIAFALMHPNVASVLFGAASPE